MAEVFVDVLRLAARYGVHRATLWRWAKTDPTFPKPVSLTPGCTRWRLSEIEAWEASKLQAA
ncbi:helix-turn-helix transcriptional regulator [Tabrizicola sp. M-4]|uniref:helix-turn-helix transcriptional regulator n=1 Tax=Tabrizicola sp. M-4 TaxID=3055847 RepID=UPI003DA8E768